MGCEGGRGKWAKKGPKWEKKFCLLHSISQESCIIWFVFMVPMCKMISPGIFFWVVKGVKGQKIAHNGKKLCLSHLISQEPYIIWLSFVVHKCKMIISPSNCFIFTKFWFSGLLGGSKGKKWPKMTKKQSVVPFYLSNHAPYDLYL